MDEINQQVADRLRALRKQAGLSLEELSARSGVSRAMLSQIETLKANPTIAVLWKVAAGLGVSFADLLGAQPAPSVRLSRLSEARFLYSSDRLFQSRPLLANVPGHKVELYELVLEPGAVEEAEPHPPGTYEQLIVSAGRVSLEAGGEAHELGARDAILFRADLAHTYRAQGTKPARALSLILYGS